MVQARRTSMKNPPMIDGMIDRTFILNALQELIRIDSRNPGLEAGAPGEWDLARYLNSQLAGLHWQSDLHELGNRRANVLAVRKGVGRGPSLMINVHMDTVGTHGMTDPFSAVFRDGRIWGRGAQDTKGGMAALLGVAKALSGDEVQLQGDLILAFVADEEHESIGTAALLRQVRADAAIVLEPTDLDVCVAHRGFGVFRLRTRGRTAHGGSSDVGIDANLHMGHVLVALDQLRRQWREKHRHTVLGSANLHIPMISGGRQLFMYADECVVDLECRTVPGQTLNDVRDELQSILDSLRDQIADFHGDVETVMWRAPYAIDPQQPIVRTVLAAASDVRGQPARTIGHGWWEDSALLGEVGIQTVVVGPHGGGLHTEAEWVDAESVIQLAHILYTTICTFCGTACSEPK